jgi:hypothetical protein
MLLKVHKPQLFAGILIITTNQNGVAQLRFSHRDHHGLPIWEISGVDAD